MIARAAIAFFALFLLDYVWAKYTYAMTEKRATGASIYASLIVLLNGAAAIVYVTNPWMLPPAVLGAFVGAYAVVKWP